MDDVKVNLGFGEVHALVKWCVFYWSRYVIWELFQNTELKEDNNNRRIVLASGSQDMLLLYANCRYPD